VFQDPLALTMEDADAGGEQRLVTVGLGSAGELLVVVYTMRGGDIRLISVRRATARERKRAMKAEYDFSKGKRGAVLPQKGKTRISIFIDNAVLDEFRARAEKAGTGYQTMMNDALRRYLAESDQPLTEKVLRTVLRQEIPEYLAARRKRKR
jgi:uncharacterized DUF497 family protein